MIGNHRWLTADIDCLDKEKDKGRLWRFVITTDAHDIIANALYKHGVIHSDNTITTKNLVVK